MKGFFSSYTSKIILFNVLAFFLFIIASMFIEENILFNNLALTPIDFISGTNWWTLLTSMFMHAGFAHLFVNMFSLFFIGRFVEKLIGKRRFFVFYLVSGILAGLFFASVSAFWGYGFLERIFGSPNISGVGASGAIFGLVGLIAVLTPKNKVYLIMGPIFAIILEMLIDPFVSSSVQTLISVLVMIYIFMSVFAMLPFSRFSRFALPVEMPFWLLPIVAIVPLIIIGLFIELPIGNMAHLGGLLVGLVYGIYLRVKYPKKTKFISNYFSK